MFAFENKVIEVPLGYNTYKVTLKKAEYANGGVAIQGYLDDCEPFATLTVWFPEQYILNDDEVFIKNWSENYTFAQAALQSGYFTDTARSIAKDYVVAPIWKMIAA